MEQNREIKFRAWLSKAKVMLEEVAVYADGTIGLDSGGLDYYVEEAGLMVDYDEEQIVRKWVDEEGAHQVDKLQEIIQGEEWIFFDKEFIALQYTGLRDKNGVEIYESDIIKTPLGHTVQVFLGKREYSNVNLYGREDYIEVNGWLTKNVKNGWIDTLDSSIIAGEVIGNIYEHPHLITTTQNQNQK